MFRDCRRQFCSGYFAGTGHRSSDRVHFNFKEYLTMTAPIQEGYPQPLCDQPAARAAAAMADRERDAAALAEQLRFERLLSEISGTLNGLDFDQINRFIPTALGNVSELLGSDLSTFLQTSEDTGEFLHTHQWVAPGVSFDMDFTGVDLAKSVPSSSRVMLKSRNVPKRRSGVLAK